MNALRFLFIRFSAFLFDMICLSLMLSVILTVIVDVLNVKIQAIDLIYELSMQNGMFKTSVYLSVIGFYYFVHVFFRKSTFGLWATHQDFAEKLPEMSKEVSEDMDLINELASKGGPSMYKRFANAFVYSSCQMVNVALCGILTIWGAFKPEQAAYHEVLSGVRICKRDKDK